MNGVGATALAPTPSGVDGEADGGSGGGGNTASRTENVDGEGRSAGASDNSAESALTSSPVASNSDAFNGTRQDYRLDFTEVEGNLEEIPEEVTAAAMSSTAAASTMTTTASDQQPPDAAPVVALTYSSSSMAAAVAAATEEESAHASTALFHIPDSNASDVAYSECSYQPHQSSEHHRTTSNSHPHGPEQPLTARQQVALWLTRTSMSDLSSVPSLRSLVFRSSGKQQQQQQNCSSSSSGAGGKLRSGSVKSGKECVRGGGGKNSMQAGIHRNFSTRSLINGYGASSLGGVGAAATMGKSDLASPGPIRKCETVMAISSSASAMSTCSAMTGNGHGSRHHPRSSSTRLSLFRRLSKRETGTNGSCCGEENVSCGGGRAGSIAMPTSASVCGTRTPQGTRSFTFSEIGDSGVESPFRVCCTFVSVFQDYDDM
jgi:hypothetical protein